MDIITARSLESRAVLTALGSDAALSQIEGGDRLVGFKRLLQVIVAQAPHCLPYQKNHLPTQASALQNESQAQACQQPGDFSWELLAHGGGQNEATRLRELLRRG
jgi:hypothetical protein